MELTAQTLQPAIAPLQQGILGLGGEVDMQARQALLFQAATQAIEQVPGHLRCAQHPLTSHRGKRNRAEQLRVIVDTGAVAGVGPAVIEHILTIGMAFHVARHRSQQLAVFAQ